MIQKMLRGRRLVAWVNGDRRCTITLHCKAFALCFYLFGYRIDLITRDISVLPNVSTAVALLENYAASIFSQLPKFMIILLVPPSSLVALLLKTGSIECDELFETINKYNRILKSSKDKPEAVSLQERFMLIQYR